VTGRDVGAVGDDVGMRPITKVFCPSNHRVGTVGADADGLLVEYTAEVWHPTAVFGAPATDRLADDVAGFMGAYCKGCNRPVQLDVRQLRESALSGAKQARGVFTDSEDKMWVGAGHAPLYESDVRRMRHDPR